MQYLLSILPKAEEAAVWIIPLPFSPFISHFWKVSTIPITVTGLTIPDAAEHKGTDESMTHTELASATAYETHDPDKVVNETLFPTKCLSASLWAYITYPVPSKPHTNGGSIWKYAPLDLNLSDGLIVEAWTLIKTCPYLGVGIGLSW